MSSNVRSDGWTAERQLRFLDTLLNTRSVTAAARAAGMSRESAHRLRKRRDGALFAALWDIAVAPASPAESHSCTPGEGRLALLLGIHFRRQSSGLVAPSGLGRAADAG